MKNSDLARIRALVPKNPRESRAKRLALERVERVRRKVRRLVEAYTLPF